jgi:hypothetical protein
LSPSYILFGFVFTALSALAAGALVGHSLRLRLPWPVAFVVGACPLSLIVALLALGGLAHKGVFLVLGLLLLAAMAALNAHQSLEPLPPLPRWFWIGFVPFTVVYFVNAMAPEISPDGATYHLGVVNRYYDAHRMIPLPHNFYASLSQGVEMLFLFAWAFGRHSAASLVHFAFLLAVPLMLAGFGVHKGLPFAGAFAGLLFYATPVAGMTGTNAYIDVAVAAAWFAIFVVLDGAGPRAALPAGMLAGFLYSAKYTAFLAILYVAWTLRRHWRALALASAAAVVFVLPWVIRNWIWYDNPVAPMMNSLFPNPLITPAFEREWTSGLRDYELTGIRDWAWNLFVNGGKISGALGPVWLLAPLGFLEWPWLLAAAAYPFNIGTRFLLPALPFLAWGIAKVVSRKRRTALVVLTAHLLLSWPYFLHWYSDGWTLDRIYWRQALRIEPEESWLNFRSQEYRVARMIETHVPPGELVYVASQVAESYTLRPIAASYQSTFSLRVRDVFLTPVLNYYWPAWRHDIKLERPAKTIRLRQTAFSDKDRWSISEISPRPVSVSAFSDEWLLGYAIDGNPNTRWHSGFQLRPGQWFEMAYESPVEQITLRMTRDQFQLRLIVDGQNAEILEQEEQDAPSATPRWATETMRQFGVRYLSITSDDFGYEDVVRDPAAWNLTLIAERGPAKLYKLN